MKQTLQSALAHEINNPLAVLRGKLDVLRHLLATDRFDQDRFRDEIGKMEAAVSRLAAAMAPKAEAALPACDAPPVDDCKVLIVEDEVELAGTLQFFLEESGIGAEICADGRQAIARLGQGGISLVISDFCLPDFNGRELLERTVDDGTPWIFVSAFPDIADQVGADPRVRRILRKPVTFRQVVDEAHAAVSLARQSLAQAPL